MRLTIVVRPLPAPQRSLGSLVGRSTDAKHRKIPAGDEAGPGSGGSDLQARMAFALH